MIGGSGGGGGGGGGGPPGGGPPDIPPELIDIGPDELKIIKMIKLFSDSVGASLGAVIKPAGSQQVRTKVREPDPFNGSDPSKLRGFLISLNLNFQDRPAAFVSQFSKINYAISYLTGTALGWFEPEILTPSPDPPLWTLSYDVFVKELEANFGPHDPTGTAEDEIETLRMRDSDKILHYNVKFNNLASVIGWDVNALMHSYYRGLPPRMKDALAIQGRPDNLRDLRSKCQEIDHRYWQRKSEQNREQRTYTSSASGSSSGSKPKPATSSSSSSGNKSDGKKDSSSGSSGAPREKPAYADKLGSDGRLTPAEKARRIAEKLCLFCGLAGHRAEDCNKRKAALKARGAKTSTPKADAPSDAAESKK